MVKQYSFPIIITVILLTDNIDCIVLNAYFAPVYCGSSREEAVSTPIKHIMLHTVHPSTVQHSEPYEFEKTNEYFKKKIVRG